MTEQRMAERSTSESSAEECHCGHSPATALVNAAAVERSSDPFPREWPLADTDAPSAATAEDIDSAEEWATVVCIVGDVFLHRGWTAAAARAGALAGALHEVIER